MNAPQVRVSLDSYDFAHPAEKQTQVFVVLPDVARASYLLPADRFDDLRDEEWGDVLDAAHEYFKNSGWVSDSGSAAGRAAVRAWLAVDENRDDLNVAWFQDRAQKDPVSRSLLRDKERLTAERERLRLRVDEVERQYIFDTAALKQRVTELEAAADESRPVDEDPIAYELTPQAEPHTGDELIGCSALHCKRGEWFAYVEERGWQHGHMDTWLCPQCADAAEERAEILARAGEPRG